MHCCLVPWSIIGLVIPPTVLLPQAAVKSFFLKCCCLCIAFLIAFFHLVCGVKKGSKHFFFPIHFFNMVYWIISTQYFLGKRQSQEYMLWKQRPCKLLPMWVKTGSRAYGTTSKLVNKSRLKWFLLFHPYVPVTRAEKTNEVDYKEPQRVFEVLGLSK